MTAPISSDTDALLRPLAAPQQSLLDIVGDTVISTGSWPVYQYVQAKLDDLGLDIDEVCAGLPSIPHGQTAYSLIRRDLHRRDEEPVQLTIAGMAHLPSFKPAVDMFIRFVNALAERRAAAPFEPGQVIKVEIVGPDLVAELGLQDAMLAGWLPIFLNGEPATFHGAQPLGERRWTYQPASFLRRFRGVGDVNDYLTRMRAWIMPPEPVPLPQSVSPLGLVAAFDYLDVVWQLKFGRKLLHVPSAERAARLAIPVATAEEFDNRLSALGEMLKGMDAAPEEGDRFLLVKLRRYLSRRLATESQPAMRTAVDILFHVTQIRNSGQHAGAAPEAATALPALGLAFPVADYAVAWRTVQAQVINALDSLRVEVSALPNYLAGPSQAARQGPARTRRRGSVHTAATPRETAP
ncbi:hypothetical protein GCM10010532_097570 [Dactylosporangium siamense]|uniref:Uncharacterized protein n=2 Tax=Dactylosporangium siamense TaxID=685454 RepID=A0A919PYW9_9ACTN|nr:hypothetical protein Dsi01nite_109500 [Dactylosporangium siamense]